MEWFASDLHLNHHTIYKVFRSKHFTSIADSDIFIIESILNKVKAGDRLYLLGDLALVNRKSDIEKSNIVYLMKKLKQKGVQVFLIRGNHDKNNLVNAIKQYCVWVKDLDTIKLQKYNTKLMLCHYPMIAWNCSHYNSIMLHGHIHEDTSIMTNKLGKIVNVAIDVNDLQIQSIEEILNKVKNKDNWDLVPRNPGEPWIKEDLIKLKG